MIDGKLKPGAVVAQRGWLRTVYYVICSIDRHNLYVQLNILHIEPIIAYRLLEFDTTCSVGDTLNVSLYLVQTFDIVGDETQ